MPELAFFRHGEELLRVALDDRTAIGRDPGCDVSLPDPGLSRVQAVVERRGDAFHLVDRSGKGTRVAGAAVPPRLASGAGAGASVRPELQPASVSSVSSPIQGPRARCVRSISFSGRWSAGPTGAG